MGYKAKGVKEKERRKEKWGKEKESKGRGRKRRREEGRGNMMPFSQHNNRDKKKGGNVGVLLFPGFWAFIFSGGIS